MNYHAHIYFELPQLELARTLYEKARSCQGTIFTVWRFFEKKVGPHHLPMFEIHFSHQDKTQVLQWIDDHRQGLSVLIHQDSGDDFKDHKTTVTWLGTELPIHFEFFHQVEADPSKAIHAPSKKA
ncbi:MAG TPA: DOPA 4,5-dioxygenase family protein [Bacteriovoracaceae bacterium]|nr:DOPA 4,5-dioxygenase family protein [Bacteriovoracaceae bacterium]